MKTQRIGTGGLPEWYQTTLCDMSSTAREVPSLLVRQAYNGYYTDPRIVELLGLEVRPPQPLGHRVDQGKIALIENVKNRGIAYREV